ncbi:hypothetical protein EVAR_102857_1 [Eumeta japonica]|uniref:Uncharacterized protein n=1 Tax=Eumeta variegata TaxID=151549 RepID=A0A4C1UMF7_EUMVA|nr:hypothetical protein EVAR_102857_1 [Eumeta japonica]
MHHTLNHQSLDVASGPSPYTPLGYHGGATATPSEVVEIRDSGGGFIHGKVTPQTRVNNRPYDVKVELIARETPTSCLSLPQRRATSVIQEAHYD